jgi:hypothetical protein
MRKSIYLTIGLLITLLFSGCDYTKIYDFEHIVYKGQKYILEYKSEVLWSPSTKLDSQKLKVRVIFVGENVPREKEYTAYGYQSDSKVRFIRFRSQTFINESYKFPTLGGEISNINKIKFSIGDEKVLISDPSIIKMFVTAYLEENKLKTEKVSGEKTKDIETEIYIKNEPMKYVIYELVRKSDGNFGLITDPNSDYMKVLPVDLNNKLQIEFQK